MKRTHFVAGVVLMTLAACGGRESARPRPLTIKGSDTMVVLGQRLAEEYMKKNQGQAVQVTGGGSGTGIAAMINGTTDLAMSSRPMKDDERSKVQQSRGAVTVERAVALDSLAVFVHNSSVVKELSIEQIKAIYTGKTKNWNELGGPNAPIVLYGRESSSGTYDYFRERVLDKDDFAPTVQALQGTAAIVNAVGKDPNGIGYGGIAYAQDVRAVPVRRAPQSPAVAPTAATVKDGTYALTRRLYFYYPQNAPRRVTQFVDWTLTPEAQALVTKVGYFPLK